MEDLGQKYSEIRPKHETFCEELFSLLTKLLNEKSIKFHTIEKRAKSIDSFKDKIVRPGKTYKNPLEEIMDLSGLRIIIYYEDDIDKVCSLIDNEFKVHFTEDKRSGLSPDQFGYNSVHKGISLSDRRADLGEWSSSKGLKAEVQIRTVLQHAWSSISHALSYKHEAGVPKPDLRSLNRLAGLLELADEEFIRLRKNKEKWNKESLVKIESKNLDIPIDSISLRNYISSSSNVNKIVDIAEGVGIVVKNAYDPTTLIIVCHIANIKGIKELEDLVIACIPKAAMFYRDMDEKHLPKKQMITNKAYLLVYLIIGFSRNRLELKELNFAAKVKMRGDFINAISEAGKVFEK